MRVTTTNADRLPGPDAIRTASDAGTGLTRITVNLTKRAMRALDAITAASGANRTDSVVQSLRTTASLLPLAYPDGTLHVLAPDDVLHVIHLP